MNLILGTVQFGLDYGITNESGKVSTIEAQHILQVASHAGIHLLDTAAAYGDSETVLGKLCHKRNEFNLISKIPSSKTHALDIRKSVDESLSRLQTSKLHAILFHDQQDVLSKESKQSFEILSELKSEQKIAHIGASFYSPDALESALAMHDLDIIQIPANCLDQRFQQSGLLDEAKRQGVEIHVRSLFLQGLLLSENNQLPTYLQQFKPELTRYFDLAKTLSLTPLQLALLYLSNNECMDYGVVGCLNRQQLIEITDASNYVQELLSEPQFKNKLDLSCLASSSEQLINPSLWK
ncbi:aldo/keto reductase [Moritella sp. 5]|uniref:aldo/keto reductase n=1 Tax=Moritella sp. 5 TaxID=2746231 RepID=UPI001BAB34C4|nr:aldo/keto reductase [Moritella sp. 5]QUM79407.1 aldo/keto reductase [Moritella sp. 5]